MAKRRRAAQASKVIASSTAIASTIGITGAVAAHEHGVASAKSQQIKELSVLPPQTTTSTVPPKIVYVVRKVAATPTQPNVGGGSNAPVTGSRGSGTGSRNSGNGGNGGTASNGPNPVVNTPGAGPSGGNTSGGVTPPPQTSPPAGTTPPATSPPPPPPPPPPTTASGGSKPK